MTQSPQSAGFADQHGVQKVGKTTNQFTHLRLCFLADLATVQTVRCNYFASPEMENVTLPC